jgi:hypothetical protein
MVIPLPPEEIVEFSALDERAAADLHERQFAFLDHRSREFHKGDRKIPASGRVGMEASGGDTVLLERHDWT